MWPANFEGARGFQEKAGSVPRVTRGGRLWIVIASSAWAIKWRFDSLAELVRRQLQADPLSGQMFVFASGGTEFAPDSSPRPRVITPAVGRFHRLRRET